MRADISKLTGGERGMLSLDLHLRAKACREQPATGELQRLIYDTFADDLDAKATEIGPAWCFICGSTDGVPSRPLEDNPRTCGFCGSLMPPPVEVRGILGYMEEA